MSKHNNRVPFPARVLPGGPPPDSGANDNRPPQPMPIPYSLTWLNPRWWGNVRVTEMGTARNISATPAGVIVLERADDTVSMIPVSRLVSLTVDRGVVNNT